MRMLIAGAAREGGRGPGRQRAGAARAWLVLLAAAVAAVAGERVVVVAYRREAVDRRRCVRRPRIDLGRRELRLVRRVGEVLGLQRQPVALAVLAAARAVEREIGRASCRERV